MRSATEENAWHEGEMTEEGLSLYRGLAAGGVGLIIAGCMGVMQQGRATDSMTLISEDRFVPGLRRISGVPHRLSGHELARPGAPGAKGTG